MVVSRGVLSNALYILGETCPRRYRNSVGHGEALRPLGNIKWYDNYLFLYIVALTT